MSVFAGWHFAEEHRYRCPECCDSGYRRVVHHNTVRDWLNGVQGFIYNAAVACNCAPGDERFPDLEVKSKNKKGQEEVAFVRYPRYDPNRHCLAEAIQQSEIKLDLLAWLEEHRQREIESQYADNWAPTTDYQTVIAGTE